MASKNGNQQMSYLRDWIYGGIDGTVTTFAVVSGVIGGKLASIVIIILGIANLLADGFSMAASNYLGTKSEHEEYERQEQQQARRIVEHAVSEKEKVRAILQSKGEIGEQLDQLTDIITSNKALWISLLLHEEHGLPKHIRSPMKAALVTFIAFIICGSVPLLPFFVPINNPFFWSALLTGIVFFLIGSMKSKWSLESWWYSGSITLGIGTVVAFIAYGIGYFLAAFAK